MSDLRKDINQILDEDEARQKPVKEAEEARQQNQKQAVDTFNAQVIPAVKEVGETFRHVTASRPTITPQLENDPSVTIEMARMMRVPTQIMLTTEALADTIHARVQIGQGSDAKQHDFPGGFEALTRQAVIEEILRCYRQSLIDDVPTAKQDAPPKQNLQGTM